MKLRRDRQRLDIHQGWPHQEGAVLLASLGRDRFTVPIFDEFIKRWIPDLAKLGS